MPFEMTQFGGYKKDHHQAVQGVDLVFGQVHLGHHDVGLAHLVTFPGEQAEMRRGEQRVGLRKPRRG